MNISLNWIKEFVSLSGLKVEDIKDELTAHTVEVEQVIRQEDRFKDVVVAKIIDVSKHPQADRLQVAIVDIGKKEDLKIVCGAPNISPGQLVPLAMVGAILPNGLEIKKAEIRGEESFGMLCAEDELGLGDNHSGIMILDKRAKIGQNFAEYLNLTDIVLEIDNKSISNRPDLWGHYGISRELSVLFDLRLKKYESKALKIKKQKEDIENVEIQVKAKKYCPRYLALKVENIKIEDSPSWLKERLIAIGIKPVNNIVDATNYIMFELGQPLHAFDADTVDKIIVRMANKNENVVTLDDGEKKLEEDDLVIANSREIISIAGVMGSKGSAINNTSTTIIIESANFDAASVRRTAQRLNSRTDAAMRFEKGLDPNLCPLAINKMAEIIKNLCPKAVFNLPVVYVDNFDDKERVIELDLLWAEKIIGQKIEDKEVRRILESLGLKVEGKDKNTLEIKIPSWRLNDLAIKEDIIEEIVRIFAYDNIEPVLPMAEIIPPEKNYEIEMERRVRNVLSLGYKFSEVYNYSFVNEDQLLKLGLDSKDYIKLLNPLSSQHTLLRQTLSTNLLSNIKNNQSRYENVNIFEIGNIFLNIAGGPNKDSDSSESLPYQEKRLAMAMARAKGESFKDLKSVAFNFIYELSRGLELEFLPTESMMPWADERERCLLILEGKEIGFLAKVDEVVANKNGIKKESAVCELDFKNLLNIISKFGKKEYESLAKFPSINRDLAFVIDKKILFNDIKKEIKEFHDLIRGVDLFDVYSGENLESDKKSMAFHITYHSKEKTLTNEEVDIIQSDLIKKMAEKFNSKVRDF